MIVLGSSGRWGQVSAKSLPFLAHRTPLARLNRKALPFLSMFGPATRQNAFKRNLCSRAYGVVAASALSFFACGARLTFLRLAPFVDRLAAEAVVSSNAEVGKVALLD